MILSKKQLFSVEKILLFFWKKEDLLIMARPKNYDVSGYIHFIEKRTGQKRTVGKGEKSRKIPETESYEVDFDYIEKLNLNKVGNEIPYTANNVWNVERYLAYFWKQIMDADCIFVWHHLWEYCDQKEGIDICFPKMTELAGRCGLSKKTLISKIKILEEHKFLLQIQRLNKRNGNKQDSPIFKMRRTIPLLSKDQYKTLTPFMKKKHDEYMEKFASETNMEWYAQKGSTVIEEIIRQTGDKMVSSKKRKEIKELIQNEQEAAYILVHLPEPMRHTLKEEEALQEAIVQKGSSRPFATMVYRDTLTIYDERGYQVHLIFPNQTQKEYAKEAINDYQLGLLEEVFKEWYKSVNQINFYTMEQYIITMLKEL